MTIEKMRFGVYCNVRIDFDKDIESLQRYPSAELYDGSKIE